MAIAGAVVDRLLRRLSSDPGLLELPPNIYEGVAHLRRALVRLQDVMVSVERQGFNMHMEVQDWMGKIKEAAYDIEDLLDELEDHKSIGSQRSACIAKATSFCSSSPFILHNTIGNRMKTLRRKLDLLAEDSVTFSSMQYSKCGLQQSDNLGEFDRASFVGRDNDKRNIKDLFMKNDTETLCIIPIVGLVGLGKTTLARLLFHDQWDGWDFGRRIWVNLSRKLDLKRIVIDIISQANESKECPSEVNTDNESHGNLQLLKNRLRELLHDKKCLIVLDNLCSTNKSQLDELKEMLRGTNKCINVLVTTPSQITSEIMHTVPPYKLLPLTEDDCWTIFSRRAFGDSDDVHARLKDIGKQIVKKCEGMPVLAHSLGSILHNQPMDVWIAAKDEELWKMEKRFSSKVEMFSPFNQTYYEMPSALKLCLLYLSLFPTGSVIDKEKLIWQWIALGMIGSKHEILPSYVHGEMYIEDLLSVYFLQVRKTCPVYGMDNRTNPTMLYMHNFIHDFARYSSHNDVIIFDDKEMQSGNAKRVTFQYALLTNYRGQSTLRSSTLTRARALHIRNSVDIKLLSESFELLMHLRVLNLSGCCIVELPASVGHLKYLTYLGVSDLKIETLPSTMSNLTNLKALDLSKTFLKGLPYFIGTFSKLQYLNLQGCEKLQNWPPTLGHLQSLDHLRLSCCYDVNELPDSLCDLHDLRFLDISRCTGVQRLPPLFGNLSSLEDLNLSGCFNLKKLPKSFSNLYFLRFLNLSSCYELRQLPGFLTNLNKLEVLILRRCYRLQNLPPFFRNRQHLRILDLSGCEALQVNTEILPTNLEYLNLERCQKLQSQSNCFVNFTKLKFLNLSRCLYTIDSSQDLGYLLNLEYLNLSQTFLDIPVSFERLQKLHTLDLTGCVLRHPSPGVPQILAYVVRKMTGLKFVLTSDPIIVAFLPEHIRCSVPTDEHWHVTSDELSVLNLTGGSRGLGIAERANIQNRQEIRFLKLDWIPTSESAAGDAVEDGGVEEVLEKLQPNQSLEQFELVGYGGSFFPTWMMSNMMSSLPNLVILHLFHLDNCKNLPPLCELQNLRYLHIKDMSNLINLEMGLSGGPRPLVKLTHLKLETLLNLEELSILLSTNSEERFMFPVLEELSVVSCSKLIFKPSFPKCLKYEIKESDNILSCGEPIGPSSSSPVEIEIAGCMIPSKLLQWFRSLRTLEKAVIDSCVGEDGQILTSLGPMEIKGKEEPSSSYTTNEVTTDNPLERITSHELATQVSVPTKKGHSSSCFQKLFPWFSTSPDHKGPLRSLSFSGFTASEDTSTIGSSTFTKSAVTGVSDDGTYLKGTILESPILKVFTFAELKIATRNFRHERLISEDGCGEVYKGWLDEKLNPSRSGDGTVVAIKKFDYAGSTGVEWQNEMNFVGRLSHPSLVKLLGYCMEDGHAFLIYEFMAKGSLQNHLFRRQANPLSWSLRVKILIGAAHGLAFLHSLKRPVIHRNIKTSNILLDSNYNAKITDLSLAKDGPDDDMSHVTTRVIGTFGYAAPEYITTGHLYVKSDVYSFGVVLLEMLCGRRTLDSNRPTRERNLVDWAKPYLTDRRRLAWAMDPRLDGQYPSKVAIRIANLASRCLSIDHKRRPSMNEVVDSLRASDPINSKPGAQSQPLPSTTLSDAAGVSSRAGVA